MSETQRLFVAITLSPNLLRQPDGRRSALANVLRELSFCGRAVTPTEPEKLHITLKFLGETQTTQVPHLEEQLALVAAQQEQFALHLRGLGVFPDERRPAVCWAGINEAAALMRLAEDVEERIVPLGFPRERRAFHPHLTLARIRAQPAPAFFELLHQHRATGFGSDWISTLVLMRSSWPAPGMYRIVGQWPLLSSSAENSRESQSRAR